MRVVQACAALAALSCLGCHDPVSVISGSVDHALAARLGTSVRIRLQNVGPGEYQSPPQVSSPALRFDDVVLAGPYVPAGPTQEFRFTAVAKGQAVITFTHSGYNPTVVDTVNVW